MSFNFNYHGIDGHRPYRRVQFAVVISFTHKRGFMKGNVIAEPNL